jgi:putative sugar O-methyltransferase
MDFYLNTFKVNNPKFSNDSIESIDYSELQSMYEELEHSAKIFQPSNLWIKLSKTHEKRLEIFGINNFKRTIITDYSHFPPFPDKSFRRIFSLWLKKPSLTIFKHIKENLGILYYAEHNLSLNGLLGIYYSLYVRVFYDLISELDILDILPKCEDPKYGNPIKVSYKNMKISYDQCSSVMEYYEIMHKIPMEIKNKPLVIGELGAGYGKLTYAFLNANNNYKYLIFDIPPTLYLAQTYLSKIYSKNKIMKFRHFDNFEDIKNEFEKSQICFFTANQLKLLPENIIDLFINISSLHEMREDQIKNFHDLINRVTKGFFYSKQYPNIIKMPKDLSGAYEISFDDYPIPKNWEIISKNTSKINPRFVNILFKI